MGQQALNESDVINYSEAWGLKVHQIVAIVLNLLVVMSSAHPLRPISQQNAYYAFAFYFLVSFVATTRYFTNGKKYQLYNFESLYYQQGGPPNHKDLRDSHPQQYFRTILAQFEHRYPDTSFEFKKMKLSKTEEFEITTDEFSFSKFWDR